ncbi:MAG: hypothetical protein ACYCSN_18585 [Acidobacteriaceae bacterium]
MHLRAIAQLLLLLAACLLAPVAPAQSRTNAMSDAEVEQVRTLAYEPNERVAFFQKMMEQRISDIEKINAAKRINDRGSQLHDLMDQFASLADELDDNFDDYQHRHWDVRRALRKLIEASAKWQEPLNQPPPDPAYDVTRKLALDAAADIHDSARKLLDDQTA